VATDTTKDGNDDADNDVEDEVEVDADEEDDNNDKPTAGESDDGVADTDRQEDLVSVWFSARTVSDDRHCADLELATRCLEYRAAIVRLLPVDTVPSWLLPLDTVSFQLLAVDEVLSRLGIFLASSVWGARAVAVPLTFTLTLTLTLVVPVTTARRFDRLWAR
jgi:hypothetical protein